MSGPSNETPETPPEEPTSEATPSGPSQTAQATAAATAALTDVRAKLVAGEQFVLSAALLIVVVSYFIFEFLLDYRVVGDFSVLLAVLTVLAIWIHRWGHYDFGAAYRIVIGALGLALALFAVLNLLTWARAGGGAGDFLGLIGLVIYWISGLVAGYGAWSVFRSRV